MVVGSILECCFTIDKGSRHSLVYFFTPESIVEKPGRSICCSVTSHVTEQAGSCVFLPSWWHHCDSHLELHLCQILLVHDLLSPLNAEGAVVCLVVSSFELWSFGLFLLWCVS